MTNFEKCISIILRNEGGDVNDPDDPGGETNYGISKRAYPNLDIKNLTIEQAKAIYLRDYWNPISLDHVWNVDNALQIFDFAVNAGLRKSVRTAQQITGITIDGIMGNMTLGKINTCSDFLDKFKTARIDFYKSIAVGNKQKFLKGWIKRVNDTHF
jgi:lysozyme family protein